MDLVRIRVKGGDGAVLTIAGWKYNEERHELVERLDQNAVGRTDEAELKEKRDNHDGSTVCIKGAAGECLHIASWKYDPERHELYEAPAAAEAEELEADDADDEQPAADEGAAAEVAGDPDFSAMSHDELDAAAAEWGLELKGRSGFPIAERRAQAAELYEALPDAEEEG